MSFFYHFSQSTNVIVSEEYLVYDFIGVVASIGGTLGLFIGFSFTNLATCLLSFIKKYKVEEDVAKVEFTTSFSQKIEESQEAIQKLQIQMDQVLKEISLRKHE